MIYFNMKKSFIGYLFLQSESLTSFSTERFACLKQQCHQKRPKQVPHQDWSMHPDNALPYTAWSEQQFLAIKL